MGKKRHNKKAKKTPYVRPWDNIIMSWDTPPHQVRLNTDSNVSISWPFGDDLAEAMSTLDDKYFKVFLKKAWVLCKEEAEKRPAAQRDAFLETQKARIEGYKNQRRSG